MWGISETQSYGSQSYVKFLALDLSTWLLAFRIHKEQENKLEKQSLERKILTNWISYSKFENKTLLKTYMKISSTPLHYAVNCCSLVLYQKIHPIWYKWGINDWSDKDDIVACSLNINSIDDFLHTIKGPKTHHAFETGRYPKEKWKGQQESKWQSWKSS